MICPQSQDVEPAARLEPCSPAPNGVALSPLSWLVVGSVLGGANRRNGPGTYCFYKLTTGLITVAPGSPQEPAKQKHPVHTQHY